jgi:hypothetical protein
MHGVFALRSEQHARTCSSCRGDMPGPASEHFFLFFLSLHLIISHAISASGVIIMLYVGVTQHALDTGQRRLTFPRGHAAPAAALRHRVLVRPDVPRGLRNPLSVMTESSAVY